MVAPTTSELLERLEPILAMVAEASERTNAARRPDRTVFRAFADAGLMRLLAPEHYGGVGVHPEDLLAVVEAIARIDGSTAWSMMTLNEELGIASAWLDPAAMTELLAVEPNVIVAGSGVASGRAEPREGGWALSGRWRFVSGCHVADRLVLNAWVDRGGATSNGRQGGPRREMCFVLVPAADVVIEDTWHVAGLAGTGSHDVVADDLFVPDRWAGVTVPSAPTLPDTPFYRLSNSLRFCFPKVAVAHGIAQSALGTFAELAGAKSPRMHGRSTLAERPFAQSAFAEAEALVGSGRAWVSVELAEMWAMASEAEPISPELHARVRLACSHAVDSSIRAVSVLADAAGTSAGEMSGPWPRLLADVRAVAQHYMVAPYQKDTAGRVLLGCDAGDPLF